MSLAITWQIMWSWWPLPLNVFTLRNAKHCNAVNSLRPRPNRRHFADDIFKCIFENENEWISPRISLKFVPKVRINNIPALVQIMAWRRRGDKPLSEPMMVRLPTHACVTRPQWVNTYENSYTHPDVAKHCSRYLFKYFSEADTMKSNVKLVLII